MANKNLTIPSFTFIKDVTTTFEIGPENEVYQFNFINAPQFDPADISSTIDIPLNQPLKGSIRFTEDRSCKSGKRYLQTIRLYRKDTRRRTVPIYDTANAHVRVSQSRVSLSMSFPMDNNPEQLLSQLQNMAAHILDEADEIAYMLSKEGTHKVQKALQTLAEENTVINQ